MTGEEKLGYAFIGFWILTILGSPGFTGLTVWAIIRLVLKYT